MTRDPRTFALSTLSLPATSLVLAPFLARALGPEGRGDVARLTALIALTSVVTLLGSRQAVAQNTSEGHPSTEFDSGVAAAVGLGLVASVVVGTLAQQSAAEFGLIVVAVPLFNWHSIVQAHLLASSDLTKATNLVLAEAILRATAVGATLATGSGPVTVAAALALSAPCAAILLRQFQVPKEVRIGAAADFGRQAAVLAPVPLQQQLSGRAGLGLTAAMLTPADFGHLIVAISVVEPSLLMARSLQPLLISNFGDSHPALKELMLLVASVVLAGAVAGFVLLEPLFGSEFAPSLNLIPVVAVTVAIQGGLSFQVAASLKRGTISPRLQGTLLLTAVFSVTLPFGASIPGGAIGAAYGMAIAAALASLLIWQADGHQRERRRSDLH